MAVIEAPLITKPGKWCLDYAVRLNSAVAFTKYKLTYGSGGSYSYYNWVYTAG